NFLQATIYAAAMRLLMGANRADLLFTNINPVEFTFLGMLLFYGVLINLSLMFFNLIPLGPLDGHWLVGQLLPEKPRYHWNRWNLQMGTYILFGLIFLGQFFHMSLLGSILGPPVGATLRFLTGLPISI